MRRLVIAAVLAVVLGAGLQIATDDDAGDVRQVAEVLPFPRSSTPLPVPEVTFQEGPWQDDVPWDAPPAEAKGFVAQCTGSSSPPCALTRRSKTD